MSELGGRITCVSLAILSNRDTLCLGHADIPAFTKDCEGKSGNYACDVFRCSKSAWEVVPEVASVL